MSRGYNTAKTWGDKKGRFATFRFSLVLAVFVFLGVNVMRERQFPKSFQMRIDPKLEQRLETISVKVGLGKASLARLALRSGLNSISRNLAAPTFEDKEAHRD